MTPEHINELRESWAKTQTHRSDFYDVKLIESDISILRVELRDLSSESNLLDNDFKAFGDEPSTRDIKNTLNTVVYLQEGVDFVQHLLGVIRKNLDNLTLGE